MKKIKLTESELTTIIRQIITEQSYAGGIIQEGDIPCDIWCERKYAKRGSRGDVVKMIQHLLARGCGDYGPYNPEKRGGGMNEGCAENWTNCDGKFGKETKKAVEEYQAATNKYQSSGLVVDGNVGINTLSALCELCYKPTVFPDDFTLCDKQCKCTQQQEDTNIIDGIDDVIDNINCDGDCDSEWIIDNWHNQIDGVDSDNCDRIKACLYYASRKDSLHWEFFINCMRGTFPHQRYT